MAIRFIAIALLFIHFSTPANSQALQFAKNIGGSQNDNANKLVVDKTGNIYIAGSFQGTNADFDPGPGVYPLNSAGSKDCFVAKYDASGKLLWAFRIGGSNTDEINDIALDGIGNLYITGYFRGSSVDFDP